MTHSNFDPLVNDIRNLKKEMQQEGLFEVDPGFHLKQHVLILVILATSLGLLTLHTTLSLVAASVLLALFYAQSAYLTHDMAHGQITRNRKTIDLLFAVMSFSQGLSIHWWKAKHSMHHAHPNTFKMSEGKVEFVDDDIDTMPFLCWDAKLLTNSELNKSAFFKAWLEIQKYAVWPLLCMLRLSWVKNGFVTGSNKERILIVAHHITVLTLATIVSGSFMTAMVWLLVANLIAGFVTGCFFLFSHSGMEVFEMKDRGNDILAQIRSTRNFTNSLAVRWLSGGLNLQLEHHLFPAMPRNRLSLAAPRLEALFQKYKLQYPMFSVAYCTSCIYKSLEISQPA